MIHDLKHSSATHFLLNQDKISIELLSVRFVDCTLGIPEKLISATPESDGTAQSVQSQGGSSIHDQTNLMTKCGGYFRVESISCVFRFSIVDLVSDEPEQYVLKRSLL